jgi:hypothetical protein
MRKTGGLAVTFYSSPDSLAFLSGWIAESVWRQKWLAAPRVPERSRPMLATAEKWLLLRHPRAAATSAGPAIRFTSQPAAVALRLIGQPIAGSPLHWHQRNRPSQISQRV